MPINFNTVAYSQKDALYRWNENRQIVIATGMKMSQFDLVSTPVTNYTLRFKHGIFFLMIPIFQLGEFLSTR